MVYILFSFESYVSEAYFLVRKNNANTHFQNTYFFGKANHTVVYSFTTFL
jgi:hypothetical protein